MPVEVEQPCSHRHYSQEEPRPRAESIRWRRGCSIFAGIFCASGSWTHSGWQMLMLRLMRTATTLRIFDWCQKRVCATMATSGRRKHPRSCETQQRLARHKLLAKALYTAPDLVGFTRCNILIVNRFAA